jgi:3-methyl-2-oxobutanoate hydroxymethyltransferase
MSSVTVNSLLAMKQRGEKIACLTAYDASFASVLDDNGVDVILVGDSLGMVIHGRSSTVAVSMHDMVYHSNAVAPSCKRALLMVDMPFMSYATAEDALRNAARLMQGGGAHMVKLEGTSNQSSVVERLAANGVPVCAHLGLRPQFVHKLGGYRVQGRGEDAAQQLADDARALEHAGADALLLECVPAGLATQISQAVRIPVIGIGAGRDCDGQVLVLYDLLGVTPGKRPRFSKDFLQGNSSVAAAIRAYVQEVKTGLFPSAEHTFQ